MVSYKNHRGNNLSQQYHNLTKGTTVKTKKPQGSELSRIVKNLHDKGVTNSRIAAMTGATRQQVAGIIAWHLHRASWDKGKNKIIAKDFCGSKFNEQKLLCIAIFA